MGSQGVTPQAGSTRQETLLNGSAAFGSSSSRNNLTPAPRIVPQPETNLNRQPSLILNILLFPFNLLYYLISKPLGLFSYLFPFLPRLLSTSNSGVASRSGAARNSTNRRHLNPRDTASRFIREFEEEYGPSPLPIFENGYAQALDLAKKDLKFLLVILVSPEHDDTPAFIRNTLLSDEVVNFIKARNDIILWAGNVQDTEAYQVSISLNCTKFPFAALVAHTPQVSSTSMSVVARIVGSTSPTAFVAKLRDAIAQHSEHLDRARTSRESRQAERSLREQQNSAYERSLAQDRERVRQRREAENARKQAEDAARKDLENQEKRARDLEHWKTWRARSLSKELGPEVKDTTRVSVRMPSGERLIRRFASDASMEELYAFVECHDILEDRAGSPEAAVNPPEDYEHKFEFRLISPMPRIIYEPDDQVPIGVRVGKNSNLIFEPVSGDDESDEEA